MPNFKDLSVGKKYLINEFDGDQVLLIEPLMVTSLCMLILIHEDVEAMQWKKLNDEIFEIIEELSIEDDEAYESLFEFEDEDFLDSGFETIEDIK